MTSQDESLLIIYMLVSTMVDKYPQAFSLDCLNVLAGCSDEIRKLVMQLDDQVPVSDLIQHQFQTRFAKETIH